MKIKLINYVYIKKNREIIKQKYGGKCAYSGTILENNWQVDHLKPIVRNWWENTAMFEKEHKIENMVPAQKIINHYKSSMHLEDFRKRMLTLYLRLRKLPKNPRTERSIKRKKYLLKIASYFGITQDKPFSGVFYFETVKQYKK